MKDTAVAVPLMCCAADMVAFPSRKQVVLVGVKSSEEFENMVAAAHAAYDPNKTVSIFHAEKLTNASYHIVQWWILLLTETVS